MKTHIYSIILAVSGLVMVGVGAYAPTSIYFPEPIAWLWLIVGFAAVGYAAHVQIVRR